MQATHHRNIQPHEVLSRLAYLVQHRRQVELRAPAGRTGDILHLRLAQPQRLQNVVADLDFVDRVFCQRDANRVANPLCQQRTDPYRALDTRVHPVPRFRDAQVQRVVHALLVHALDHQAVGGEHNRHAARLERNYQVLEPVRLADTDILHRRFDHSDGRIAVHDLDAFGEAAVIDADAHRQPALLARFNHGQKRLLNRFQFLLNLSGAIVYAVRVRLAEHEQPWVDAHLVDMLGAFEGDVHALMVDIGDEGDMPVAASPQFAADFAEILRLAQVGRSNAHDFAARFVELDNLRDRRFGVHRLGGDHRLDADGVVAADADVADLDLARAAARLTQRQLHRRQRNNRVHSGLILPAWLDDLA
jgi:hypothetical protein